MTPRSCRTSPGVLLIGQDIPHRHFLSVHREDEHGESASSRDSTGCRRFWAWDCAGEKQKWAWGIPLGAF